MGAILEYDINQAAQLLRVKKSICNILNNSASLVTRRLKLHFSSLKNGCGNGRGHVRGSKVHSHIKEFCVTGIYGIVTFLILS